MTQAVRRCRARSAVRDYANGSLMLSMRVDLPPRLLSFLFIFEKFDRNHGRDGTALARRIGRRARTPLDGRKRRAPQLRSRRGAPFSSALGAACRVRALIPSGDPNIARDGRARGAGSPRKRDADFPSLYANVVATVTMSWASRSASVRTYCIFIARRSASNNNNKLYFIL